MILGDTLQLARVGFEVVAFRLTVVVFEVFVGLGPVAS